MHLHIFFNSDNVTPEQIKKSGVASARLRTSPIIEVAHEAELGLSLGNFAPANTTAAVVTKIGSLDIDKRENQWIHQIKLLSAAGHPVTVDYSDHHLGFASPQRGFYSEAAETCTNIVTPSTALTEEIKKIVTGTKCHTIYDVLEYPQCEPKRDPCSKEIRAMWFGHPANAKFLARFIDEYSAAMADQHLTVISMKETVQILEKYPYKHSPLLRLRFVPWSPKAVLDSARQADYCVIPSDNKSPKRFASNNRLVAALALGLPTIATTIPSYHEFSDFYAEERTASALEVMRNPVSIRDKVCRFQEEHLDKFTLANIAKKWRSLLL